jgi:hypothetical protein
MISISLLLVNQYTCFKIEKKLENLLQTQKREEMRGAVPLSPLSSLGEMTHMSDLSMRANIGQRVGPTYLSTMLFSFYNRKSAKRMP